jgi:hypothetical protein
MLWRVALAGFLTLFLAAAGQTSRAQFNGCSAGFCAPTGAAASAFSHIQGAITVSATTCTSTVVTTLALSLGGAVGSGHTVTGLVSYGLGSVAPTVSSITDDKSNTYTLVDNAIKAGATNTWGTSFFLQNITNGPTTITANFSQGVRFNRMLLDEYSGVAASSPLDGHTAQNQNTPGTGANVVTSGNFTTASNGDLIIGSTVYLATNSAVTAGTSPLSYTLRTGDLNGCALESEDANQTTASASTAATFGLTVQNQMLTFGFALK